MLVQRKILLVGYALIIIAAVALAVFSSSPTASAELEYAGSDFCGLCHNTEELPIYNEWEVSKHKEAYSDPAFQSEWIAGGSKGECLECHTTGWIGDGDYALEGVHCEKCHGVAHTAKIDKSASLCGQCHTGSAQPQYETWEISEHVKVDVVCITCHKPHSLELAATTSRALCERCHTSTAAVFEGSPHEKRDVLCTNCHMYGTDPHGPALNNHSFAIWTSYACWQPGCHSEATLSLTTVSVVQSGTSELISSADSVIKDANSAISSADAKIKEAEGKGVDVSAARSKIADASTKVTQATDGLNTVINDKSKGFHNREKAARMLSNAINLARDGKVLATEALGLAEVGLEKVEAESAVAQVGTVQMAAVILVGASVAALIIGIGIGRVTKRTKKK